MTNPEMIINQWRKPKRPKEAGLYTEYTYYCIRERKNRTTKGWLIEFFPKNQIWRFSDNIEFHYEHITFGSETSIAYQEELLGLFKHIQPHNPSLANRLKENFEQELHPTCKYIPIVDFYRLGICHMLAAIYMAKQPMKFKNPNEYNDGY